MPQKGPKVCPDDESSNCKMRLHCNAGIQANTWRDWHALGPDEQVHLGGPPPEAYQLPERAVHLSHRLLDLFGVTTVWAWVAMTAVYCSASESYGQCPYLLCIISTVRQADTQEALTISKGVLQLLQGLLISMEGWGCIATVASECVCEVMSRINTIHAILWRFCTSCNSQATGHTNCGSHLSPKKGAVTVTSRAALPCF